MTAHSVRFSLKWFDSGRWGRRNWIGEALPKLDLWVSAQESLCVEINSALAEFGLSGKWTIQPLQLGHYQLSVHKAIATDLPPLIASRLGRIGIIGEMELTVHSGFERYLIHPALGIGRFDLDHSGEVLIRAGAIENALAQSHGNPVEFRRLLRKLDGTLWLDLIQPYRSRSEKISLLNRAG